MSPWIEELDDKVIEDVKVVCLDWLSNALLTIHDTGDCVVNAVQLCGGVALHFRRGKRGEIGAH